MDQLNKVSKKNDIHYIKKEIEDKFSINTYKLGSELDMIKLTHSIIEFFS